jgi:hypothetical protein
MLDSIPPSTSGRSNNWHYGDWARSAGARLISTGEAVTDGVNLAKTPFRQSERAETTRWSLGFRISADLLRTHGRVIYQAYDCRIAQWALIRRSPKLPLSMDGSG